MLHGFTSSGISFYISSVKSRSGPSAGLPVEFSKCSISLDLFSDFAVETGTVALSEPKSMRSPPWVFGLLASSLTGFLGGIAKSPFSLCPSTTGYIDRNCLVCSSGEADGSLCMA